MTPDDIARWPSSSRSFRRYATRRRRPPSGRPCSPSCAPRRRDAPEIYPRYARDIHEMHARARGARSRHRLCISRASRQERVTELSAALEEAQNEIAARVEKSKQFGNMRLVRDHTHAICCDTHSDNCCDTYAADYLADAHQEERDHTRAARPAQGERDRVEGRRRGLRRLIWSAIVVESRS